jgi:hypothetical protein
VADPHLRVAAAPDAVLQVVQDEASIIRSIFTGYAD